MAKRGLFIVIEGIDGAGTTTQAALLRARLASQGQPVHVTREPSDGPIGTLIRQVLTGRVVVPGGRAPGWTTMALLFAADRVDHVEAEIEPLLASGTTVISDRYDASSLAYQSATSGGDAGATEWIRTLNQRALRPDLTVVLGLSAEVATSRRAARGETAQLYEQSELQRRLADFYLRLPETMPEDRIVVLDGGRSIDDVAAKIYEAYLAAVA